MLQSSSNPMRAELFRRERPPEGPPDRGLEDRPDDVRFARRGLHPGRAGDGLRARGQVDARDPRLLDDPAAAGEGEEPVVGIVVDEVQALAALLGIVARRGLPLVEGGEDGADDRRGLAALGDADDDVALADAPVLELEPADEQEVLEALERGDEGPVGAGHLADEAVLDVRADRRRELLPESCRRP